MRRRRFVPAMLAGPLIAFLVASAVAGCGEPGPRQGGTAVVVSTAGLDLFNPLVTASAYTQEVNRHLLFVPLLRYDSALGLAPGLASAWEWEGDSTVVFHLRDDVAWADSVPTTAFDAAFTFRRALDPDVAFPNAGYFAGWRGVEAVDSFRLRVRLDPAGEPLAGVPLLPIVPAHVLDTVPPEALRSARFGQAPVTNGPFRLVESRAGDRWIFASNPAFPEGLGGPPRLDRLVWRVVPEAQAQVAELVTGNAHLALEPPADRFDSLAARPDLVGLTKPSFRYSFIAWNGRRPPLDRPVVRRALTQALDRPEILAGSRHGYGRLAHGPVPPSHWAFAELEGLPFDTAAAREALAAEGFRQRDDDPHLEAPDGSELRLRLLIPAGSDATRDLAQIVQAQLARVGVRLEIRALEFGTLVQTITGPARDFDAVLLALDADARLDLASLFHSRALQGPFQLAGYSTPRLDSLLDATMRLPRGDSARATWAAIQQTLVEDQPWTFLYHYTDLILARPELRGVDLDLRGTLRSAPDWWLAAPDL